MSTDLNEYLGVFADESNEHLESLNSNLLILEENPDNMDTVNEIFRSAHTLKGMSATMGFKDIAELTHKMENLLDRIRNQEMHVNNEIVDLLFSCLDSLSSMVEDVISGTESTADISGLVQRLIEMVESKGEAAPATEAGADAAPATESEFSFEMSEYDSTILEEVKSKEMNLFQIYVELHADCVLKSVRVFMVSKNLGDLGEILKTNPESHLLDNGDFDKGFHLLLATAEDEKKVHDAISVVSEIENIEVKQFSAEAPSATEQPAGETPVEDQAGSAPEPASESTPQTAVTRPEARTPQKAEAKKDAKVPKVTRTIRVDTEKLDALLNLVGELVINKTRLAQHSLIAKDQTLNEVAENINLVSADLQAVVMKARMVPIEQVFNRFPRMVRDLSRKNNKRISLQMSGQETELDRTVIEEIGDPLVHLIRNSIDHGIEAESERARVSKDLSGTIWLSSFNEGNKVFIEVRDDGKGIDADKIVAKAISRGLITEEGAAEMTHAQKLDLIFAPGLSTSETITDISGRGVGMDVVRTKVESLSGSVHIDSTPGEGTRVRIELPLTLAIVQALLVDIGGEEYAIPLASIDETLRIEQDQIQMIDKRPVYVLRGDILPLINLREMLDFPEEEMERARPEFVVVARVGGQRAGLQVDSLIGQQEIVIKNLGELLLNVRYLSGATILGDGTVALILDAAQIIN